MSKKKLTPNEILGQNIRARRHDMSQADFANTLGVSRGYLSDLERGARQISVPTLVDICKTLDTDPTTLLSFKLER